jgi:hypothetical protein
MGLYTQQLEQYLRRFPRRNVFIGIYDDLLERPNRFYEDLWSFLGVANESIAAANARVNETMAVRSQLAARLLRHARQAVPPDLRARLWASTPWQRTLTALRPLYRLNVREPDPPSRAALDQLHNYYEQEVADLELLLGRELESWRCS